MQCAQHSILFFQSGSKIKNTRALLGYFDLRNAKGRTTGTAVPYLYTAYIHLISVTVGEKSRKVTDLEKSAMQIWTSVGSRLADA